MGLRFFLPDGMRFSCERCGECCGGWSVPVDARDYKTLIEAGVCEGRKLFQRVVFKKKRFLRLVEDRCVLLAKDGLCSAYDHRPSICRLFPFRVRDTPSGLFVGLSYSCRSVAYGRGRPLSELSAMVSALSVNRGVEQPACESVSLDGVSQLRWDGYMALEERLMEMLSTGRLPDSLLSGWRLLLYLSSKLDSGLPAGRGEVDSAVSTFFDRGFSEVEGNMRKSLPPVSYRIAVARIMLPTEVEGVLPLGLLRVFSNFMRIAAGSGSVSFRTQPRAVSLSELSKVEYSFGGQDEYIREYLRHFIFRKDLLRGLSVADNYYLMLLAYCLSKWYSLLNAHAGSRSRPSYEDVVEAVRLVERNYILHSNRFIKMFSGKMSARLLEKYFENHLFVPTMLYGSPFG